MTNWQITWFLVTAPLKGALFCIFLPFIGFYLLGKLLVERAWTTMRRLKHKRTVTA